LSLHLILLLVGRQSCTLRKRSLAVSSFGISSLLDRSGTGQPQAWLDNVSITLFAHKATRSFEPVSDTNQQALHSMISLRLNHARAQPHFRSTGAHKCTSPSEKYMVIQWRDSLDGRAEVMGYHVERNAVLWLQRIFPVRMEKAIVQDIPVAAREGRSSRDTLSMNLQYSYDRTEGTFWAKRKGPRSSRNIW